MEGTGVMKSLAARILADKNSLGAIASLAMVGCGAVLAFIMLSVAARVLGPQEFGRFATWFNVCSFLAVIAALGQETFIGRSWNEYAGNGRLDLAKGAARFGARNIVLGVALAVMGSAALGVVLRIEPAIIVFGAAFVACFALQNFLYQFTRSVAGHLVSDALYEGVMRAIVIVGLAAAYGAWGSATAHVTLGLMAIGFLLTALLMVLVIARKVPAETWQTAPTSDAVAWRRRSARMWLAAILEATSQYLDVVVISVLLGPLLAGSYFVATRIAAVFAKVTHAVNTRAAAQVSYLYYRNELAELDRLIRGMSIVSVGVIAVGLPALLLLGKLLLPVFGEVYVREFPTLTVLAIGTALTALAGPAPLVLLHTGQEGFYSKAVLAGLLARIALFALLAPTLGTLGVAVGWSVTAIATAIYLNIACRRRVGVDPSVLVLLRPVPVTTSRPA